MSQIPSSTHEIYAWLAWKPRKEISYYRSTSNTNLTVFTLFNAPGLLPFQKALIKLDQRDWKFFYQVRGRCRNTSKTFEEFHKPRQERTFGAFALVQSVKANKPQGWDAFKPFTVKRHKQPTLPVPVLVRFMFVWKANIKHSTAAAIFRWHDAVSLPRSGSDNISCKRLLSRLFGFLAWPRRWCAKSITQHRQDQSVKINDQLRPLQRLNPHLNVLVTNLSELQK